MSDSSDSDSEEKQYIFVDYKDRNKVRKRGAKWDSDKKLWYYFGSKSDEFSKWSNEEERTYIDCSYDDRAEVKKLGGRWCSKLKLWYCYPRYKNKVLKRFREIE